MAATDKTLRDQNTLDIVFAVSNILMLVSVFWMLYQDYAREYKDEQRAFREVERAMAQHAALQSFPDDTDFANAEAEVKRTLKERNAHEADLSTARAEIMTLKPQKQRADAAYQEVKADVDSITSFIVIALENNEKDNAERYRARLANLNTDLDKKKADADAIDAKMKAEQLKIEKYEGPYTKAAADFKKVNDKLDAQVKLAISKKWGWGDWFRTLPVINGFADPLKIHQFTINDIPIDYNFKYVTRYDRCMSCHVGIDRPAFTRENLVSLKKSAGQSKLDQAIDLYKKRVKALDPKDTATIPDPSKIELVNLDPDVTLTPARMREFAAHPRLDLYVGGNSKHPAEKFGCSACHYGQGSGTSFIDASHTPNNSRTRTSWSDNKGWEPNHMWDFPMLPTRFTESSCLKCHHEVTDLISTDNRQEAPKLLRGYNLIKENGCFGCHEISGWKSGNRIGPDLRLEPTPPLEEPYMTAIEIDRAKKDPDNRPGNLRKVGPALTRVSEKVTTEWIEKWLYSPSSFRPDTKMPHYYNLSTNNEEALAKDDALIKDPTLKQSSHPKTEIASIAYFLTKNSKDYLAKADAQRDADAKKPTAAKDDETRLLQLLNMGRLNDAEQRELAQVKERLKLRREVKLVDQAPNYKGDKENGQALFIERGCLSCHTHQGTEAKNVMSEALFGPNLSQLPAKIGTSEASHRWLVAWILNPQAHSPRSRMPVTHLDAKQAADVAAWLLSVPATELGEKWNEIKIDQPERKDLENLARVYLTRMLSKSDMDRFFKGLSKEDAEKFRATKKVDDPAVTIMLNDVTEEEKILFGNVTDDKALMHYLGKKAVNRLGCFACHDIPGFENVKSIGVGLNDWGKKPADRLAFEDIGNFFKEHYYAVPSLVDKNGNPNKGVKIEKVERDGKKVEVSLEPYEKFYADVLMGHNPERMGYLNQKIRDPRSYDYNRARTWDDRARMPKFTFARPRKHKGEDDSAFEKRMFKEEAEAREAVATFVLGLTAELVPAKMTNSSMTTDRLAEVKGRQVLDKYNCAGCHIIRPGAYDFDAGKDSATLANLLKAHGTESELMKKVGEIEMLNHVNWVGRNSVASDRLTAFAVQPFLNKDAGTRLSLNPSEALRFKDASGKVMNIPANKRFFVDPSDLLPPKGGSVDTEEDIKYAFRNVAQYGGTFANLMVPYLAKKDAKKYPLDPDGDSADARASLPPSLIGQGERTQSDWLNAFLLNPTPVRKLSILRMPKFNMSKDEADAIAAYFAAVTRQTNPGVGLTFPLEAIPQRDDIDRDGGYWQKKTAEYVARLRKLPARDLDGKEMKGPGDKAMTAFEQRIAEYTPVWEKMVKEQEKSIKDDFKKAGDIAAAREKELLEKEKKLTKDKAKDAELQKEIDALKASIKDGEIEKTKLEASLKDLSVKKLRENWEEKEAYAADAYRMVTSRKLCAQCHQIGNIAPSEKDKQGPPLALANQRLRPDWIVYWVNKPQRFVPYASLMPTYFSDQEWKWQPLHAGVAIEQIQAARDVLINFPRVSEMPINRIYNPDLPADKK